MYEWIIAWKVVLFVACVFYFGVAALVALNGAREIADTLGIRRDQKTGKPPEE